MTGQFQRETEPGPDYGLSRLWLVLRSNLVLILAIVFVTAAAATGATLLQPITYESTVTLVVQDRERGDIETLTRTLGALLRSETIGKDLELSGISLPSREIAKRISVERPPGSGVLEIRVSDTSAERSRLIAAALVPAFVDRVANQLEDAPQAGKPSTSAPALRAWDTSPDTQRVPRPLTRNGAVASVLGLILAAFAVAVRERMSPGISSAAEAEAFLGLPVLGSLPPLESHRRGMAAPLDGVRAILAAAERDGWKQLRSILVAGPTSASERAQFCLLLSLALVDSGKRVLLVDADFETRALSRRLGLPYADGLTEIIRSNARPDDVAVPLAGIGGLTPLTGAAAKPGALSVVPAGRRAAEEPSLLVSIDIVSALRDQRGNRVVVINGPSLVGPNPVWGLASSVDAVLTVIGEGSNVWTAKATVDLVKARSPIAAAVLLSSRRMEVRGSDRPASGSLRSLAPEPLIVGNGSPNGRKVRSKPAPESP